MINCFHWLSLGTVDVFYNFVCLLSTPKSLFLDSWQFNYKDSGFYQLSYNYLLMKLMQKQLSFKKSFVGKHINDDI